MNDDKQTATALQLEVISQIRVEALLHELTKRVMVVNEEGLKHLQDRGVIALMARDGCCKPDGGTCCPNKRVRFDRGVIPGDSG